MDVTDALRRIVLRHLVLIGLCTLIPVIIFAAYNSTKPASFTAVAQLEVADRASTSAQQATSVADTAIVQVKVQSAVLQALTALNIKQDPAAFLANNLAVDPVLTAPDIMISVSYTNAQDAVNIAQQMAKQTGDYFYHQEVDGMNADLTSLKTNLATVTADFKSLSQKSSAVPVGLSNPYTSAIAIDANNIQNLTKSISDETTKVTNAYTPAIIDPAHIVPKGTLAKYQPYVIVIALGIILGLGIGAILESASPSVVGAAGLAGLFGAPSLGYAVGRNGKIEGRITDLALAARLHAAARRVGADTVVIAGDVRCDIPDLAGRLDALLGGATNQQIHSTMQGSADQGPGAMNNPMLGAGDGSKDVALRGGNAPAMFSERLSFGEDIPSVWVHPRVVPYDEQVLLLLSTAPVSVAVAVVGVPKGKRKNLLPAIELVETSGWDILGTILADPTRKA